MVFRFPIAIKKPLGYNFEEIQCFVDEAKSMIRVGDYHNHIVNLQGVVYELKGPDNHLSKVVIRN